MIKGPKDYYKHGDQNAICDRCGFKYKLSELKEDGYGWMVCAADWEPKHPRDLPMPPRPEAPPKPGSPELDPVFDSVTYASTPTVPSGTFSGTSGHSE